MADIDRQNELIHAAVEGRREECRTDAERTFYDRIVRDAARMEQYGIGMDMVHESYDQ